MAVKDLPEKSDLLQLLRYEPDTGKLFWRERDVSLFPAKAALRSIALCRLWNARYAYQEAFTSLNDGYRHGSIMGSNYKAHRVIWRMVTGCAPDQIDHINGNRADNRIENLRDVSLPENARNRQLPVNNTSGVIGVYFWKKGEIEYWVAQVGEKQSKYFQTFDDAVAARKAAEIEYGFHGNHGRAA